MEHVFPASMNPPATTKSRRYSEKEWEKMKPHIEGFHPIRGFTIKALAGFLKDTHGFDVTEKQLKDKISKWNLFINVRNNEMRAIDRIDQQRTTKGKKTGFRVRGRDVDRSKLERWRKRKPNSQQIVPQQSAPSPTPSVISCFTINSPSPYRTPTPIPNQSSTSITIISCPESSSNPLMPWPSVTSPHSLDDKSFMFAFGTTEDPPSDRFVELDEDEIDDQAFTALTPHDNCSPKGKSVAVFPTNSRYPPDVFKPGAASIISQKLHIQSGLAEFSWDSVINFDRLFGTAGISTSSSFDFTFDTGTGSDNLEANYSPEWICGMMAVRFATLYHQGSYKAAAEISRQVLATSRHHFGDNHWRTIHSLRQVILILRSLGYQSSAYGLFTTLHSRALMVLPSSETTLLRIESELAYCSSYLSNYKEAEKLFHHILQTGGPNGSQLPPDHPLMIISILGLAEILRQIGNPLEGEKIMREVGASCLGEQGKFEEAEQRCRQLYKLRVKISGPHHPETLVDHQNLAIILYRQGRYHEAEAIFNEILESQKKIMGALHPDTLLTKSNIFSSLVDQGNYDEAEKLARELSPELEMVNGLDHLGTCIFFSDFGCMRYRQGRLQEALELFDKAWNGFVEKLGVEHPRTVAYMAGRSQVIEALRRQQEMEHGYGYDVSQFTL